MEESIIFPVHHTRLPDYPSTDYKIIQMLTARLSRVSLQRYPDTDYTIRLTTTGDNLPSRRHLSSSFGEMTNYPDIVTLSQTFRHPLLLTKVTKDQVALSSTGLLGKKVSNDRVVCHLGARKRSTIERAGKMKVIDARG